MSLKSNYIMFTFSDRDFIHSKRDSVMCIIVIVFPKIFNLLLLLLTTDGDLIMWLIRFEIKLLLSIYKIIRTITEQSDTHTAVATFWFQFQFWFQWTEKYLIPIPKCLKISVIDSGSAHLCTTWTNLTHQMYHTINLYVHWNMVLMFPCLINRNSLSSWFKGHCSKLNFPHLLSGQGGLQPGARSWKGSSGV